MWSLISVLGLLMVSSYMPCCGASVWEDVVTCVYNLSNNSIIEPMTPNNSRTSLRDEISLFEIFSLICRNQDRFVHCLDHGLKHNKDGITRVIGSLFESERVIQAYDGLCSNISSIKQNGSDVFGCLSTTKLTACQSEVADFFFYMGLVKRLGAPSEQLTHDTMEELLCSLTEKRRICEVKALRECNSDLGDVMDDFYRQTQPNMCRQE